MAPFADSTGEYLVHVMLGAERPGVMWGEHPRPCGANGYSIVNRTPPSMIPAVMA